MSIIASDVLKRARIILQDGGAVRWPLTELVGWLNDGVKELALRKPSATSINAVLTMDLGTKQTLPSTYSALIRVIRNVTGPGPAYVGSDVVTPIVREILDVQKPGWHDPLRVPFRPIVRHVVFDAFAPETFYVYPGNSGAGKIECTLSQIPTPIAPAGSEDPDDIDTYNKTIPVMAIYQSALLDFLLYRAFSKDMQMVGAADRAQAHYVQFAGAVDAKTQTEGVYNVNTTASQPNS